MIDDGWESAIANEGPITNCFTKKVKETLDGELCAKGVCNDDVIIVLYTYA